MSPLDDRVPGAATPLHVSRTREAQAQAPSREFPPGADRWPDGVSRRRFVSLLGATLAAAGAARCAGPTGDIVPVVTRTPESAPGVPLHFATALELDGHATGVLVESREGRPIKIDGNPRHPASLGATTAWQQATLLDLYHPDRSAGVSRRGRAASDRACRAAFAPDEIARLAGATGAGFHLLLAPTAAPVTLDLIDRVRARFPDMHVQAYAPLATHAAERGAAMIYGRPAQPLLALDAATVVVDVDADLLATGPFCLRYARQFADGRRVRSADAGMNRLYAVDASFTSTSLAADHRLPIDPTDVPGLLRDLLDALLRLDGSEPSGRIAGAPPPPRPGAGRWQTWVRAVAADLAANRGRSLVVTGSRQPPVAHALTYLINELLGNAGLTITFVASSIPDELRQSDVTSAIDALRAGDARVVVAAGVNPSYDLPAAFDFGRTLARAPRSLAIDFYPTETAADAEWFAPLAHPLEAWGDARAVDGTASIVQPLIAPLFGAESLLSWLAYWAGDPRPPHDIVQAFWQRPDRLGAAAESWHGALRAGVIDDTAAPLLSLSPVWPDLAAAAPEREPASAIGIIEPDDGEASARTPDGTIEIAAAFVPAPSIYDGRFANNAWLQELPDPAATLTWDNAALISPATARRFGLRTGDLVDVGVADGSQPPAPVRLPICELPGVAAGLMVVWLGYGRTAGSIGTDVGANVYRLRAAIDRWTARVRLTRAAVLGIGLQHTLAVTGGPASLEDRPIALETTLGAYRADPDFVRSQRGPAVSLYDRPSVGRQWGMAIDLSVCTGCKACVVACQAENNIPSVGRDAVAEGRQMHWLRIDRYFDGADESPRAVLQPMLCQHCEDAPCEYVCPVNATVHSRDGLNEMIYNRCVGTRFCSNNCPYKVRRFNWLEYTSDRSETERLVWNPDVTVRGRGVMEKCTFCVQRVRRADIDAGLSGSDEPYARLETACQQACPTRAIVFGAVTDADAAVSRDALAPQAYDVLHELGTRPRVHYLARIRNVNPELREVAR